MQIYSFGRLFGRPAGQARFRGDSGREWGLYEVARELAGLTGLLGWLGVLYYLTAIFAARLA